MATTALGSFVWLASGTACSVTSGGGGAGGTTVGVTTTATSTTAGMTMTGPCTDTMGCAKCNTCVTAFNCGVANTNMTLCKCGTGAPLGLYTTFYNCLCGMDGNSGVCGAKCSKTCRGTGTDAMDCMGCLGLAAATNDKCKASYDACKAG